MGMALNYDELYIENNIIDMHIESIENIIDSFMEESIIFEQIIMEEEENNSNQSNPADNVDKSGSIETKGKNNPKFKERVKTVLGKLKELLEKFVGAITGIFNKMKNKIGQIKQRILEKFKADGTAINDQTVLRFDLVQPNVEKLKAIRNDLENDVITPIYNDNEPNTTDLSDYESRLKEVEYNKIAGDDSNLFEYKKGQKVSVSFLQNGAKALDGKNEDIGNSSSNQKKHISVISKIINAIQGGKDDANVTLLQKACNLSMRITKDIIKYNTRYIGDFMKLVLNCSTGNAKNGAAEVKQKVVNKVTKK